MYDNNNIFALILRGELPSHKIYEDDLCFAFLDIFPINPGHFLVIPKRPSTYLYDLEDEIVGHLFKVGKKLAKALRASGVSCQGINYLLSEGSSAGQEVFHTHLHVIPRFEKDGFGFKYSEKNRQGLPQDQLASIAQKIRLAAQLQEGAD